MGSPWLDFSHAIVDPMPPHSHDDLYYTEAEVDALLALRALLVHTHDDRYFTEAEVTALLTGYSAVGHTHDSRYYTETEVDALIAAIPALIATAVEAAVPIGTIKDFVSSTAPSASWVVMTGQTITNAQTLNTVLWGRAPTTWRSGSNLILPDTRGKVSVGLDTGDAIFDVIGETGGNKNGQVISHDHQMYSGGSLVVPLTTNNANPGLGTATMGTHVAAGVHRTSTDGSAATNANVQPYVVFPKMLKVL